MPVESRLGHDAKDVRGAGQCHTTVFSWCAFDSRTGRRSTIPLCTRLSACPDGEWPNLLVVVRDTLASRAGPVHQLRRPGRLRSPAETYLVEEVPVPLLDQSQVRAIANQLRNQPSRAKHKKSLLFPHELAICLQLPAGQLP